MKENLWHTPWIRCCIFSDDQFTFTLTSPQLLNHADGLFAHIVRYVSLRFPWRCFTSHLTGFFSEPLYLVSFSHTVNECTLCRIRSMIYCRGPKWPMFPLFKIIIITFIFSDQGDQMGRCRRLDWPGRVAARDKKVSCCRCVLWT